MITVGQLRDPAIAPFEFWIEGAFSAPVGLVGVYVTRVVAAADDLRGSTPTALHPRHLSIRVRGIGPTSPRGAR